MLLKKYSIFGDMYIRDVLIPKNNSFWCDIFTSWLCVMKNTECKKYNINNKYCNIPIWFNSNIKIDKKDVFFKTWYQKGVKTIGDFLSADGSCLSKNVFQQNFNLQHVCTMQYNSIISAISRYLKCISVDRSTFTKGLLPTCSLPYYFENIVPNEKCTKIIYNSINKTNVIPTSIPKWKTEFSPFGTTDICVHDAFKVCFKTTTDSSVQWLQFRILHRILPVSYYLKKIHIKTDDSCTFCKNESETILHVFFMCEKIMPLWRDFSLYNYI